MDVNKKEDEIETNEPYNRTAFSSRFKLKLCGKCLPFKCNPIILYIYIDQVICSKVMSTISHFLLFILTENDNNKN